MHLVPSVAAWHWSWASVRAIINVPTVCQAPFWVLFSSLRSGDMIAHEVCYRCRISPRSVIDFFFHSYYLIQSLQEHCGFCRCGKKGSEWLSHLPKDTQWPGSRAEQDASPEHWPFPYSPPLLSPCNSRACGYLAGITWGSPALALCPQWPLPFPRRGWARGGTLPCSPSSRRWTRTSCPIGSSIRLEIKCTVTIMCLNHPETIPPTPGPWKNCLPRNWFLVAKRWLPRWLSIEESTCQAGDMGWSLGQELATHSSILAWEIPWTEEPGRLQSMGSHKSQIRLND